VCRDRADEESGGMYCQVRRRALKERGGARRCVWVLVEATGLVLVLLVVGERRHRHWRHVAGLLIDPAQNPVIQLHQAQIEMIK
jgi:hypothetical protein